MSDNTPEKWVAMDEICAYLDTSRDTVIRWIKERKMPAAKMGRFWKFKISLVDTWVMAGGAADEAKK